MVIKYEIWKSDAKIGLAKEVNYEIGDAYEKDTEPEMIKAFTSLDSAFVELRKFDCYLNRVQGTNGTILVAKEYYIVEAMYDDSNNPISKNIVAFAKSSEEKTRKRI